MSPFGKQTALNSSKGQKRQRGSQKYDRAAISNSIDAISLASLYSLYTVLSKPIRSQGKTPGLQCCSLLVFNDNDFQGKGLLSLDSTMWRSCNGGHSCSSGFAHQRFHADLLPLSGRHTENDSPRHSLAVARSVCVQVRTAFKVMESASLRQTHS